MKTTVLDIEGMTCEACVKHVTEALLAVPGVQKADVNLEKKRATFTHVDRLDVSSAIESVALEGYQSRIRK